MKPVVQEPDRCEQAQWEADWLQYEVVWKMGSPVSHTAIAASEFMAENLDAALRQGNVGIIGKCSTRGM